MSSVVWYDTLANIVLLDYYTRESLMKAGPSGRAVQGVGLRPLACWDRGFESHRGHGCSSVVSVVCCQVEVSATSWSLVQRSPTDCDASFVWSRNLKNEEAMASVGPQAKGGRKKRQMETLKACI